MKCFLKSLLCMHLDYYTCLLTVQNMLTVNYFWAILDVHALWSINDIQFWMFLAQSTDLDTKNIKKFFQLMDFDESGELEYSEFYVWICLMIAVKDRIEKQFMLKHLRTLTDIIDEDMSGMLDIPEFLQLGTLLNFNLQTMERIYDTYDWELAEDRDKIKYYRIKFLIMTLMDEERGYQARRRVLRWKKYKREYIFSLTLPILRWMKRKVLPEPHLFWQAFQDTPLPTFEKHIYPGCCYYFWLVVWTGISFPFRAMWYVISWPCKVCLQWRWVKAIFRCWGCVILAIWRSIGNFFVFIFCIKKCGPACYTWMVEHTELKDEEKLIALDPSNYKYYHRNEKRIKRDAKFRTFHASRAAKYEHLDIWEQPWVSQQLAEAQRQRAYYDLHSPDLDRLHYEYRTPPPTPPLYYRNDEWKEVVRGRCVASRVDPNYKPPLVIPLEEINKRMEAVKRMKKLRLDRERRQMTRPHYGEHHLFEDPANTAMARKHRWYTITKKPEPRRRSLVGYTNPLVKQQVAIHPYAFNRRASPVLERREK